MSTGSLEQLIETEDLGLDVFHPGGTEISRELARLVGITKGTRVLEMAAGTGETARLLASEFGAHVTTIDRSPLMIARQRAVSDAFPSTIRVVRGDAHWLPFDSGRFDVVLSECALCQLDKGTAVTELLRVLAPGGLVGVHDLCWARDAPNRLKARLVELEGERPETADGWTGLFTGLGCVDVQVLDRSPVVRTWTQATRRTLGPRGYLRTAWLALRRWGWRGLGRILATERIFSNKHLGYVMVLARKPH